MKLRKLLVGALFCMAFALGCFGFVSCTSKPLELSVSTLTLEAYDDYRITVIEELDNVTWSTSDKTIATVTDNGLIRCWGKTGEVTITAKSRAKKGTCSIRVVDSGYSVRLSGGEVLCYVNGETELPVTLRYNDQTYTDYTVTSFAFEDSSVAAFENGKLKGLKAGETTATMKVEWKGLTVKSKEEIRVIVKDEYVLNTENEAYEIYDVNAASVVKQNNATINANLFVRGAEIADAVFTATIEEGAEYFSVDDCLTVTAKNVSQEQSGKVKVSCTYEGREVSKIVDVKIYPDYVQKANSEFTVSLTTASYDLYNGEVGGRTGVYKYYTDENCVGTGDWIKWNNHLELLSLKTLNGKSQYDYIVGTCGYAVVSFDVYYTGQEVDGTRQYRGVSVNAQYGPNSGDSIYYVGHVKNVKERIVTQDGVQTNTLMPNTWVTFYVDLRLLDVGAKIDTYLSSLRVGDVTYVDNIRYWYDDAAIRNLDKSNVDLNERELTEENEATKLHAPNNEFVAYSTLYTSLSEKTDDTEAYYEYTANALPDFGGTNLLSEATARKIYPSNVYNGKTVAKNVKYMSFMYKYVSGSPTLVLYDRLAEASSYISLHDTEVTDSKVRLYDKDGNKITKPVQNEWIVVLLEMHINPKSNDTMFLTTSKAGTSFCLKDINYWTTDDCKYIIGYNALFEVEVSELDFAQVGTTISLRDLIVANYKGKPTDDYTLKDVSIDNEAIATYADGVITLAGGGTTTLTLTVGYENGEYSYEDSFTITVKCYGKDSLEIEDENVTLNLANDALSEAEIIVKTLLIKGELLSVDGNVAAEITEGSDVVFLDGLKIVGLKTGTAKIKVYCTKEGSEELFAMVNVTVKNTAWSLIKNPSENRFENNVITLEQDTWNDYLILMETDGRNKTNPAFSSDYDVRQNMIKKERNYLSFTIKVTSGAVSVFAPFVSGTSNTQVYMKISTTGMSMHCLVQTISPDLYKDVLRLYNEDGKRLTSNDALTADATYTVLIAYDATSTGWAEVAVKGAIGVAELSNVTYYSSWDKKDEYFETADGSGWALKPESVNTFENNKLTLSENIWTDYLTLSALDAHVNKTYEKDYEVRAYMQNKGFAYVEFTVKVESGTTRIYLPVIDENDEKNTQAYVAFAADGTLSAVNDCVWNYVTVTAADGSTVEKDGAIAKDTTYTVRIKYETNATGWADISIKGSATVVTLSEAKFYADK